MNMRVLAAAATLVISGAAAAADQVSWPFDEATEGENVQVVWKDAVVPGAHAFDLVTTIDQVIVTVRFSIFTFDIDVTDDVPAEERSVELIVPGPAPVSLGAQSIVFPAPPEEPGIAATFEVSIDGAGVGRLDISDVTLGFVQVEVPGFGLQNVEITAIRVVGGSIIQSVERGDVNRDCVVDFDDLIAALASWGACPLDATCPADDDFDGIVGFNDLIAVLSNWD